MQQVSALSHNLRRLRDGKKLSQAQVAERANLSRVAYGNIESGSSNPKVDTLVRIAQALEVRLQDLLTPVRVLKAVRFRAEKKMTSREQVLVDVARWLEDYSELETTLDERVPFPFARLAKALARKPPGPNRAREAAAEARAQLKLGPSEPIRDICGLLQDRSGIKVYPMPLASEGFFGLSVGIEDGGPAVVVNVWDRISVERWIFTAAHELGHLLLHLSAYDVAEATEDEGEEREADQFASYFLMPDEVFWREWNEARGLHLLDRVLKIKHIFRVSYRTVLYRLSDVPAYGKNIWMQFQVAHKQRFGYGLKKTDEPRGLVPEDFHPSMVADRAADEPRRLGNEVFIEDRLVRLVRQAHERQQISLGRAAEILGIDLAAMKEQSASWVD
jgi:Zn-dependent peptidase ImmA (M78 family)/transcriptional regulator with XRE-family HTH domain